ncbi:MAG: hypothetical protein Q4D53_00650 [Leptotrichiaceae bacterium]|nr:hypothetical protein [Leptotrichiaceae bacterium]
MKKLITLVIIMLITSCSLFDTKAWEEVRKERKDGGHKCVRNYNGYTVCGYPK